tara:strand:- start:5504 stop:5728 length:225 start_codon:yes stop_codon:yes gene_type:complete
MKNIFKEHPNSVGETYLEHFFKASSFGVKLLLIAIRVFVHAIFPWCFENTASDQVRRLNKILQSRKDSIDPNKN